MRRGCRYDNFAGLEQVEREGQDYLRRVIQRASPALILAPHGGGIEPGTTEIARAIAGEHFSLYCFEGLKRVGNEDLHIPSTAFDEPLCIGMLSQADMVIAIHGCEGLEQVVHLGGRDEGLRTRLIAALRRAGFTAIEDDSHHAGDHPDNLCNRGRSGMGVQLEISQGLRRAMFTGFERPGRQEPTGAFYRFVEAIRLVLSDLERRE